MDAQMNKTDNPEEIPRLHLPDYPLLWISLATWVALFIVGTLVNSQPFRERFMILEGPFYPDLLTDGLIVIVSYTLTNVALLCILASVLGTLGRRAQLGSNRRRSKHRDTVNPRSSAVLRGFVVYLGLISGVLVFGDDPASPTQNQYVRLAGFASLLSFVVNWNPSLFVDLLDKIMKKQRDEAETQTAAEAKPN